MVGPMITYLLPLLIGYTGGKLVGGDRGAVVGCNHNYGRDCRYRHPNVYGSNDGWPNGWLGNQKIR